MNEPRRHHYVPRVYLKKFCSSSSKSDNIYVFDKINKKSFNSNIINVAIETDFYKLLNDKDQYFLEKFYANEVEPKYPDIVNKLNYICDLSMNDSKVMDCKQKKDLSIFMCYQLLRTRKAKDFFINISRKTGEEVLSNIKSELYEYLNKDQQDFLMKFIITDNFVKDQTLQIMNEPDRIKLFSEQLSNRHWIVYYNTQYKQNPFITSDHPVSYLNIKKNSMSFEDNGLGLDKTLIFFPLTPKILLGLYPKPLYFGKLADLDSRMIITNETKFINYMNDIQIKQAKRFVFSSVKSSLYIKGE